VALPDGSAGKWMPIGTLLTQPEGTIVVDHPEAAATGRLVFLESRDLPGSNSEGRGSGR
jgi:hypothetical protein